MFAQADAMNLEGIVSKRRGSTYKSGGSSAWQKTKTYTTGTFAVIGASKTPSGIPTALLATMGDEGPVYVGSAFVNMGAAARDRFWRYVKDHEMDRPAVRMPRMTATWVQPGLVVDVRYLRGEGMLRHASLIGIDAPRVAVAAGQNFRTLPRTGATVLAHVNPAWRRNLSVETDRSASQRLRP